MQSTDIAKSVVSECEVVSVRGGTHEAGCFVCCLAMRSEYSARMGRLVGAPLTFTFNSIEYPDPEMG